jgi:hypothetical protein
MKNPSLFVRFAGRPLIAFLFCACSGLVIYGWYLADVGWWWAFSAILSGLRALSAIGTLRRYKAWRAEWDAMGRTDSTPTAAPKRRWKRGVLTALVLLIVPAMCTLPAVIANTALFNVLRWGWLLLVFYLVFRVLRRMFRGAWNRMGRSRQARMDKAMDAPIEFAVGRASGCPTRASAERNLPDYCLRIMGRN